MNRVDPRGEYRIVDHCDLNLPEPPEGERHNRAKGGHLLTLTEGYVTGPHADCSAPGCLESIFFRWPAGDSI